MNIYRRTYPSWPVIGLSLLLVILLSGCGPSTGKKTMAKHSPSYYRDEARHALKLAEKSSPPERQNHQLEAAHSFLKGNFTTEAEEVLNRLSVVYLDNQGLAYKKLLEAYCALLKQLPSRALTKLNLILPYQLSEERQRLYYQVRAEAHAALFEHWRAVSDRLQLASLLPDSEKMANWQSLWQSLQALSLRELHEHEAQTQDPLLKGWLSLAQLDKHYRSASDPSQQNAFQVAYQEWLIHYPNHPGALIVKPSPEETQPLTTQHIALLLPSQGPHASSAQAIRDGFMAAYYQVPPHKQKLHVHIFDTGNGQQIKNAYQKAIEANADVIVGPLTKPEVKVMLGVNPSVPLLALNTVPSNHPPKKVYQFGLVPEDEITALTELAWQKGARQALILVPKSEWGERLFALFKTSWLEKGGNITKKATLVMEQDLRPQIRDILDAKEIDKNNPQSGPKRRQDIDVIFLAASPDQGRQIKPLLDYYYAHDIPVYAASNIYSGMPSPNKDFDLNGIKFCDMPCLLDQQSAINSLRGQEVPQTLQTAPRLFALGMDAYRLAIKLMQTEPEWPVTGLTGYLQLNEQQQVKRRLLCAEMVGGTPQLLAQ